ncbi:hypothetical protein [Rhodococcus qingshengii]|uniref:hypothetical protein n=1 Tax=Rhodococcus qingshengii TaxID=334542 RepID=UPI0035DA7F5A
MDNTKDHHESSFPRIDIPIVPPSEDALTRLQDLLGLSRTDVVNRAIQVYGYLEKEKSRGTRILLEYRDKYREELHWS